MKTGKKTEIERTGNKGKKKRYCGQLKKIRKKNEGDGN